MFKTQDMAASVDMFGRTSMKVFKTLKIGLLAVGTSTLLMAGVSFADAAAIKIADGAIAAPLTATAGDAAKGRKAAINRKQGNCLACHAISSLANQPFHGEVGPSLDGVASRYSDGQLRLILVDSKKVFEGTIMPAFYKKDGYTRINKKFKGKTILSAQTIEDIIAFLKTQ